MTGLMAMGGLSGEQGMEKKNICPLILQSSAIAGQDSPTITISSSHHELLTDSACFQTSLTDLGCSSLGSVLGKAVPSIWGSGYLEAIFLTRISDRKSCKGPFKKAKISESPKELRKANF